MYQVDFTPGAESDLSRLDAPIAQRVLKRLRWLAENFEAIKPDWNDLETCKTQVSERSRTRKRLPESDNGRERRSS